MQNIHLHHRIRRKRENEINLPFFAICIPLLNCFASAVIVKISLYFCSVFRRHLLRLPLDNRILFESETAGGYYVGWDYTDFILSECYARDFRQWFTFLFLPKKKPWKMANKRITRTYRKLEWSRLKKRKRENLNRKIKLTKKNELLLVAHKKRMLSK